MKWVIHIGTQKTGSKAIQKFLSKYSMVSESQKFCFPKSGRTRGWHQSLYDELITGKNYKWRMAALEAIESVAEVGVISYEGLYRLSSPQIKLIYEVLGSANIVLFLRRQDQLANSFYNQMIMAHRMGMNFIRDFEENMSDYNSDFDHMVTISKWAGVFGEHCVTPIIYDKRTSVVEQFLQEIGQADWIVDVEEQGKNPNPALNIEAIKILRAVKLINETTEIDLPYLVGIAQRILRENLVDTYRDGDQYILPLSQRKEIYSHYSDSNAEVRRRFFPDKDKLFLPLENIDIDHTDIVVNKEFVSRIFEEAGASIPENILDNF